MDMARICIITVVIGVTHTGCASLVVGGAAGAGGYYASQDGHNPGKQPDDATITSRINAKYANDDLISAFDIQVDTYQGVVTLNGTVKTQAAASHAVDLARSTQKVKRVISRIGVKP